MAVIPNEQGGPYIFISYSHKIKDKAEEVIKALQTDGYRVWFDTGLTPGSSYNDVIAERIEQSEVFCCLLSEEYYQSQYCRQEFLFAKEELRKPVIPVYVGKLEAIKAALPAGTRMWLAGVHAIELMSIEIFLNQIEGSGLVTKCRRISGTGGNNNIPEKQITADACEIVSPTVGSNAEQNRFIYSREGDIIKFGHYEQGYGIEPIEWIVLAREDSRILVVSRYGLDAKPYNTERKIYLTWENCALREWLNTTFMDIAFTDAEKRLIREETVTNDDNPVYGTDGGSDTRDHIFLLSIEEAKKFFVDDEARRCGTTGYAKSLGGKSDTWYKWWYRWWLRSPGYNSFNAAIVKSDGSIGFGGDYVHYYGNYLRPALWINLNSSLVL